MVISSQNNLRKYRTKGHEQDCYTVLCTLCLYRNNNNIEKCVGIGLNGFIFKKINLNLNINLNEKKYPGNV